METNNAWVERGLHANRRVAVQLNDFHLGTRCAHQRVPLGDGVIPLVRIVRTLNAAGAADVHDIEPVGPTIEELGYETANRSAHWRRTRRASILDA